MAKIILVFCLSLQVALSLADCATFTPSANTTYVTDGTPIVISDGQTCSGPTDCFYGTAVALKTLLEDIESLDQNNITFYDTLVGGIVSDNRTINASGTIDMQNKLYDLIAAASGLTLVPQTTVNLTGKYPLTLVAGKSGFLTFTPSHKCVSGAVSNCTGTDGPQNGDVIEACTAFSHGPRFCIKPSDYDCLVGIPKVVITDTQTAKDTHCWPCVLEMQAKKDATQPGAKSAAVVNGVDISLMVTAAAGALLLASTI